MVYRLFMHAVMAWYQSMRVYSLSSQTLSHVPSRNVRENLADVISIRSSQLATLVLLLSQNGTVGSDWSASHEY